MCESHWSGVRAKALPDICRPMKNDIRGHLPPEEITGVDNCPLFNFTKMSLKLLFWPKLPLQRHFFLMVAARGLIMS